MQFEIGVISVHALKPRSARPATAAHQEPAQTGTGSAASVRTNLIFLKKSYGNITLCVFFLKKVTIGCGGMSRENVTVFESKGDEQVRRKINLFYVGNNNCF